MDIVSTEYHCLAFESETFLLRVAGEDLLENRVLYLSIEATQHIIHQ